MYTSLLVIDIGEPLRETGPHSITTSKSSGVMVIPATSFHMGRARWRLRGFLVRMATPKRSPRKRKCCRSLADVQVGSNT